MNSFLDCFEKYRYLKQTEKHLKYLYVPFKVKQTNKQFKYFKTFLYNFAILNVKLISDLISLAPDDYSEQIVVYNLII